VTSQSIATIGTFLTLTSLLGTFFYIQLTTWLRDLITLNSKYELNAGGTTADENKALLECKYTLRGLYTELPLISSFAITIFIAVVAILAFGVLSGYLTTDPLAVRIAIAFGVFLAIYLLLVSYLLVRGYVIGARLGRRLI